MGTANNNGGTIISFPPNHFVTSRMPSHHPNGCANITFQIPSIANTVKKNTNTAERRANHNAVERARRECLNTKFQDLARALPSLSQVKRPSKSIIVQRSLEFIYNVRQKEALREREMQNIRAENESLHSTSSSSNNSNTSSSQSTSSTSSPYIQQLTDEPKEDAEISKIATTTTISQSPKNIKLEADNLSITPSTNTIISNNNINNNNIIIDVMSNSINNINAMNNNHNNNNVNSANIMIENTIATNNNNDCGNCNNINGSCCNSNAEFVNIKNEEFCSDDDRRIDDDIMDLSEKLNGKISVSDNNIDDQHAIYNNIGLIYPPFSMEPSGYPSNFFATIDMTSIDQIVDPNSLQIQFEHDSMNNSN
nr:2346_t:CDS:2 [Entrophospora candida]CAG8528030.1 9032_t:CDS:2 [Entrophospora candida]